ncbi:GtrA family protein [Sphingobium bisphenolivorans]|uniref:GtrA family protein n=1 Tax=Sphingobium bisphenolivorans TaxID=1335760 RepID=UPI00039C9D57|nr:GtrA family protein [Sphingobium bisphenolivorans]
MPRERRSLFQKAYLYFLVGGCAAILDLSIFYLLIRQELSTAIAAITSFLIAALANYLLSSMIVFQADLSLRRLGSFMAGASAGLLMNSALTVALADIRGLEPILSKAIAIGITFAFNFSINSFLVFRRPRPQ